MIEQQDSSTVNVLAGARDKWEFRGAGGTAHKTYFDKSTNEWLRTHDAYESGDILEKELRILKASLAGFEPERLETLVRVIDFEGKPAIISPDFGKTLPFLHSQAKKLETQLPPSFFREMIKDAKEMTKKW